MSSNSPSIYGFLFFVSFLNLLIIFPKINFLVRGKIKRNPNKSVAKPGTINNKAANAIAAPEIISGAAIAFASLLLIIPGFATDILGFLLVFPLTRKLIFGKFIKKFSNEKRNKKPYIEGEFEDIEEDDERKL